MIQHQTPKPKPKRTRATRNQEKRTATKQSLDFSTLSPLSNLESPNLSNGLNNIMPDSNMSQFPNLDSLMRQNQMNLTGISGGAEEDAEPAEKAKRPDKFSKMEEAFTEQFCMLGATVAAFSQDDGLVIVGRAQPLSNKLVALAKQNPAVYRAFKKYLDGSVYMLLAEEVATISLAIMANHGINPVAALIAKMRGGADGKANVSAVA